MAQSPLWLRRLFGRSGGEPPAPGSPPGPPGTTAPRIRGSRSIPKEVISRIIQLLRLGWLVIEALIAARIILKVLGANEQAGFTSLMYTLSSPFVAPFRGSAGHQPVFADTLVNGHPFELSSLLAMGIYAVLAYLAVRIAHLISSSLA